MLYRWFPCLRANCMDPLAVAVHSAVAHYLLRQIVQSQEICLVDSVCIANARDPSACRYLETFGNCYSTFVTWGYLCAIKGHSTVCTSSTAVAWHMHYHLLFSCRERLRDNTMMVLLTLEHKIRDACCQKYVNIPLPFVWQYNMFTLINTRLRILSLFPY